MANLERRHRRLVGRNIDDEVDVPGPVAIEGKRGLRTLLMFEAGYSNSTSLRPGIKDHRPRSQIAADKFPINTVRQESAEAMAPSWVIRELRDHGRWYSDANARFKLLVR
ncbi:uncharacterized protein PV06_05410 [Exophiala oligosperma]|uniref:Uncharacterized protein n=1 Tax=Exophiala oligosperma TaxID=215243 RepID=A0A0D2BWE4_9EURO|nr:uncharacterized protein PV06_05410 [Exophiala oligosperma]KIW41797.1 hypothetical protein PV06_05410 [Exophiala oligosperma]